MMIYMYIQICHLTCVDVPFFFFFFLLLMHELVFFYPLYRTAEIVVSVFLLSLFDISQYDTDTDR